MKSPCIKVCAMDPQRGLCAGCYRFLEEITRWSEMSDAERGRVLAELPARQSRLECDLDVAKISVPPLA